MRRRWKARTRHLDVTELTTNIKAEDVAEMTREEFLKHLEGYLTQPSIIWNMLMEKQRRKEKPTLREAAMEAETLLTNYLADDKFPEGSDCQVVRDMLRTALRRIDKYENHYLKGGFDQDARNELCLCGIIRENHWVGHMGVLVCPTVVGGIFRSTGKRL